MSTNFLKLLKPEASVSRNGFDLSQKHVFSTKPGDGTPVCSIETVPGDNFEIDLAALTRTRTIDTAAFVRGKFRYDAFFVPYVQLWHPFEQFITQRDDKHSVLQLGHMNPPCVDMGAFVAFIAAQYTAVDTGDTANVFVDVHGHPVVFGAIRLLDMLGFTDFRWILKHIDEYGYDDVLQHAVTDYSGHYVNVFRLAAYQHIWYDYYRNKYWDLEDNDKVSRVARYGHSYIDYFNFDDVPCDGFGANLICSVADAGRGANNASPDTRRLAGLLTLRQIQYKKDLFTASLPSQQFGPISSVDLNGVRIQNTTSGSNYATAQVTPSSSSNSNQLYANGRDGSYTWNIRSAFDVLQLRKAEALQNWRQNTLRAGNMTDDAFKAHFGVEPYYYDDNNVRWLGTFESSLDINTVQATAETNLSGNGRVGDLAATGTSVTRGDKIKFDVRDFGVIMFIEYFVPDVEYRSEMIDKANRLFDDFDFFTPEFQNIGLDAIVNADFDATLNYVSANSVLGYAPRYWQYKIALDKCHGEFGYQGTLQHWVAPRLGSLTTEGNGLRPLSDFYVRRDFLDNIFGVQSDDRQATDQFIHNVFFDVKAIRPMSVLGLPQF